MNGKAIKIEGGSYMVEIPERRGVRAGRGMGRGAGSPGFERSTMLCICPKCGYKEVKAGGEPCVMKKCPECGSMMIRGD